MAATLPLDFDGLVRLGKTLRGALQKTADDIGIPKVLSVGPVITITCFVLILPAALAVVVQGILGVGTFFAVQVLTLIGKVRTENADDFNKVIGAALSEFLGTEIDGSTLPGGKGPGGIGARMQAIGGALHDTLLREMTGSSEITPDEGTANARRFSGFAINFATASAFIAILTECESLGFLKEFRELGVETAEALGLGRLQRLALQPLIRNLIQQPYDLALRKQFRPDRLGESQIVRALRAGQLQDAQARDMLAEKGYRDSDIDLLIADLTGKLPVSEIYTLLRNGDFTEQQAIDRLSNQGMDPDDAKLILKALSESRADSQLGSILSDLEAAYVDRFIDSATFTNVLSKLPLSDDEESMYRVRVGLQQEVPRKRITFAQLTTGVIEGIVDFTYVDEWLAAEGYSDQDQLVLTYEILQKLKTAEDKAKAKQHLTTKAATKGKTLPGNLQA
jgi:hypothetical protein